MIARIRGRLAAVSVSSVVVDVGGVGYRVHVPDRIVPALGALGSEVDLHTYMHVRDSEIALFGASDPETLQLFQLLITVSGVGPRLAMTMLGTLDVEATYRAVEGEDVVTLTRVPGVGKKTAQRMILDLKGKLPDLGGGGGSSAPPADDALLALTSLGYTAAEARAALARLEQSDDAAQSASADDRIRGALRILARG